MKTEFEKFLETLNLENFAHGNPDIEDLERLLSKWKCDTNKLMIEQSFDSNESFYCFGEFVNCIYKIGQNLLTGECYIEHVDVEQL